MLSAPLYVDQASRQFFSEVSKNFDVMPFELGALADEKTARLGVTECVKHELLQPFKVLLEQDDGALVAQFKLLVLVTKNGNLRGTTDVSFNPGTVKSERTLEDEELVALLKTTVGSKNKKKNKKKKSADGGDATSPAESPADGAAAKE